jgi:cell division protein ZapA
MAEPRVVQIEVHGQKYPIRTELDARYVEELAGFVEARMAMAAKASPSSDAVGLAILAALNIADEYFRSRSSHTSNSSTLAERTAALERMLDEALNLTRMA